MEYCTYHKNDPPPPLSESKEDVEVIRRRADNISEWDMQFIKVENDDLLELILAANYMDIKPLLDLGCMTVANMIKGKVVYLNEHGEPFYSLFVTFVYASLLYSDCRRD